MPTVKELEKENAKLKEQIAGLEKALAEAKTVQASARPSKSREQAEQVKAILDEKGVITKDELLKINPKYPSDGVYYAKNLLKLQIIRAHGCYWTPKALDAHEAVEKLKEPDAKKATPAPSSAATPTPEPPRQAAAAN